MCVFPAPAPSLHLLIADSNIWEQLLPFADTLRELHLQGSYATEIPDSIRQFRALESLKLTECPALTQVSDALGELPLLQELTIQKCKHLRRLPDTLHRLPALRRLNIDVPELVALPDTLGDCALLESLSLEGGGRYSPLPVPTLHCPQLRWLHLHALDMNTLPDDFFTQLTALESLTLRYNSLTDLPESLSQCAALRKLDVSANRFAQLPVAVLSLQYLEQLFLGENRLESLPDDFYFPKLKRLDVNGNRLSSLPDSFRRFEANAPEIAFMENPFTSPPLFFLEWEEQAAKRLDWSGATKPNLKLLEEHGKDLIAYFTAVETPKERRAAVYRLLTGKSKEGMSVVMDGLAHPWSLLNERAWLQLERLYDKAFQQKRPTNGTAIALVGEMPLDADWLQTALRDSGFVVTDMPNEATEYAVAGLGVAWQDDWQRKGLVWMSPRQLATILEQKGQLYLTASADYEAQLMQLMDSDDETNAMVALEMMRTGGVPKPLFADLLILALTIGLEPIGKQCEQLILLYGSPLLRPLLLFGIQEYKPGAGVHPLVIDRKRWAQYWKAIEAGALDKDRLFYYFNKLQVSYTRPYWAQLEGEALHAEVRRYLAAHEGTVQTHTFPRWDMLADYPEIQQLDLSFSGFKKIPDGFLEQVPQIRHLNISNNNLTEIPDSIGLLQQLETLDISNNYLTHFPVVLESLPRLQQILCSGNPFVKQLKQDYSKGKAIAHPDPALFDLSGLAVEIRRK